MTPAEQATARNLALMAARSGRCPECEMQTVIASWADTPEGRERLVEASCMSCTYVWPRSA